MTIFYIADSTTEMKQDSNAWEEWTTALLCEVVQAREIDGVSCKNLSSRVDTPTLRAIIFRSRSAHVTRELALVPVALCSVDALHHAIMSLLSNHCSFSTFSDRVT